MSELKDVSGKKRYILKDPIMFAEEKIYQLEFHPLLAKDHLKVERETKGAGPLEVSCMYLQLITRADPYVIENLSHRDLLGAMEIVNDFLGTNLKTT